MSDAAVLAELDAAFDAAWRRNHVAAPLIGGVEKTTAGEPVVTVWSKLVLALICAPKRMPVDCRNATTS